MSPTAPYHIVQELRREVLLPRSGQKLHAARHTQHNVTALDAMMPEGGFVLEAVHEFCYSNASAMAASLAFAAGLLVGFGSQSPVVIVVGRGNDLCTPGIQTFGLAAADTFYIHANSEQDAAWALEECLLSGAATAVFAEINQLNFVNSRRFQLAAEKSGTVCFLFNNNPVAGKYNAVQSRWRVSSLPSVSVNGMPGIGMPAWEVEVLKMRHGHTGTSQVYWDGKKMRQIPAEKDLHKVPLRKAV